MDALERAEATLKRPFVPHPIEASSNKPESYFKGTTLSKNAKLNAIGSTLLIVEGTARMSPTTTRTILLDTAADRNFASRRCAGELGPIEIGPEMRVEVASGEEIISNEYVTTHLKIGSFTLRIKLVILDLPSHDIIFGLPWFLQYKPQFDWVHLSLLVRAKGTSYVLQTIKGPREVRSVELNLISVRTLRKMQKKLPSYLYFVRQVDKKSSSNLPADIPQQFQKVIHQFQGCFRSELPETLPPTRVVQHPIETGDAKPVNIQPYQLSHSQLEEQVQQIKELLDKKLIRTSASPWGFPVLFVKKPGGEWRMCIDYRALNNVTVKNTYPLPRIQDCLDRIGKAKVISKLDLLSGFWQVRNKEDHIEKTAFNTRQGKFEFLVMPMGLTNAPATFQTLMNTVLQPFLDRSVIVYLDDIVIFSDSDEQHEKHLSEVLSVLQKNQLFAKPSKCIIGAREVEFCGHVVGNGVLKTSRSKTAVLESWPVPKTAHDIRSFLGLASYYRRFVRGFAQIAAPLSELLKEKDEAVRKRRFRPIIWTARCQHSFELLKQGLVSGPVLAQPDFNQPFTIETDASEWAVGACLSQLGKDGLWHPVAYEGRKLQGAEYNYSVQDKELLAIKHALRTWSHYIDNHTRTKVITDHKSLKYLKDTKEPSKRLAHWIAEFGTYDLDITYRPGSENTVPDAISRRADFIGEGEAYQHATLSMIRTVDETEWEQAMIEYLRTRIEPENEKLRKVLLEDRHHPASSFVLDGSQLYKQTGTGKSPYLPPVTRKAYLERIHKDYGHLGWPGLSGALKNRAWWPSIERDVQDQIKTCPACQTAQAPKLSQERGPRNTLERAGIGLFDSWSIDLIGRLPRTYRENRWIITAIERSTGWPIVKAVKDATEQTVIDFIHKEIFSVYGIPYEVLSDNGSNLVSIATESFLATTKLKHRHTTPYHPQTNGKLERFNGILGKILAKCLYGRPTNMWDEYLNQAVFATRIRIHAVSKYSPFYLLYGVDPKLPGDSIEGRDTSAEAKIEEAIHRHAAANDARLAANKALVEKAMRVGLVRDEYFKSLSAIPVGKFVLVRDESPTKFRPKWFGPYRIIMAAPIGTYALQDCHNNIVRSLIHGSRLLPLADSSIDPTTRQWKSSFNIENIRKSYELLQPNSETKETLERDSWPGFTYKELAAVKTSEWVEMQSKGLDSSKIGEGKNGPVQGSTFEEGILEKLRNRVKALEREQRKQDIPLDSDDIPVQTPLPACITHSIPALELGRARENRPSPLEAPIPLQALPRSTPTLIRHQPNQEDFPQTSIEHRQALAKHQTRGQGTANEHGSNIDQTLEDQSPASDDPGTIIVDTGIALPPTCKTSHGRKKKTGTRKGSTRSKNTSLEAQIESRASNSTYSLRRGPRKVWPKNT